MDIKCRKQSPNALVSVIVPAYNTEKYIEKCLYSLKRQTYNNIEVILIDDGSTDGTAHICEKYKSEDARFHFIKKINTGVSDTRNIGIQKSEGKYVVFVDSDDYVEREYIETLVKGIEFYSVQMACVEYKIVCDGIETIHQNMEKDVFLNAGSAINLLANKDAFQGYLWNKIFVKDIICNNNIMFDRNIKIWEDMLFCLKYLTCISKVAYLHPAVYCYVQRDESAMNNSIIWMEHTHIIALEKMWEICKNISGDFREYIRNFYANDLVGLLGKDIYEKEDVLNTFKTIKQLHGKLSLKHRIKLNVFRILNIIKKVK